MKLPPRFQRSGIWLAKGLPALGGAVGDQGSEFRFHKSNKPNKPNKPDKPNKLKTWFLQL